ncbi:collagen-like protein [Anaeromyxobacter paludicola]|uniref:Collagen triple helix repeat protein n=1 Tax=Anaeromyxobacter paludicola TaxID=2918171 RepID=A0ABN6NF77_9BACT|nr:collagen-like protein [Anaeromyxobacter paludicola]BDG10702.1 hypothetical protein AMPC_38150 [Anaeromyxobacter paludicola]
MMLRRRVAAALASALLAGCPNRDQYKGPKGDPGAQGPQGVTGPQGPAGAAGPAGPVGPAGATGAQGPPGATGPAGPVGAPGLGITWRGPWSASTRYAVNDAVQYLGSSYVASSPSTGSAPPAAGWALFAAQGATGAAGPQGVPGPQGLAGPAGATGPAGPQGAQGLPGPQGLAGPAGATGPAGPQGAQGLQGLQGVQGPAGPQGPAGAPGSPLAVVRDAAAALVGPLVAVAGAQVYTVETVGGSRVVLARDLASGAAVTTTPVYFTGAGCTGTPYGTGHALALGGRVYSLASTPTALSFGSTLAGGACGQGATATAFPGTDVGPEPAVAGPLSIVAQ